MSFYPRKQILKKLNRPKKSVNLLSANMMVADCWFCAEDELTLRENIIVLICLLDGILSIFKGNYLKLGNN